MYRHSARGSFPLSLSFLVPLLTTVSAPGEQNVVFRLLVTAILSVLRVVSGTEQALNKHLWGAARADGLWLAQSHAHSWLEQRCTGDSRRANPGPPSLPWAAGVEQTRAGEASYWLPGALSSLPCLS